MTEFTEAITSNPLQEKWGAALNDGFVVIPSALLRHQHELGIDGGEVVVLLNLLMSWWKASDMPFPQTSTLAKRMGVSRRTVQRHVESLEKKQFIRRMWNGTSEKTDRAVARYDLSGIVARLKILGSVAHPNRKVGTDSSTQPPTAAIPSASKLALGKY
ncbi:MAG: helix-turn-helix domain-containing protein [Pseudomonadota bacterium]